MRMTFRNSFSNSGASCSSGMTANSGALAPPAKTRIKNFPSGARCSYFTLLKLPAKIGLCSIFGTTKPKPRNSCLTCAKSNAKVAIAVPSCSISPNFSASTGTLFRSTLDESATEPAMMTASKSCDSFCFSQRREGHKGFCSPSSSPLCLCEKQDTCHFPSGILSMCVTSVPS
jgi:hypothetical protein